MYNVAWNGSILIHADNLPAVDGHLGIDIMARKAPNPDVNDVIGEWSFFGQWLGWDKRSAEVQEGIVRFNADRTVSMTYVNSQGYSDVFSSTWALDDANAVVHAAGTSGPALLCDGGMMVGFNITVAHYPGYIIFVKRTSAAVAAEKIAGTYLVRSLESSVFGDVHTVYTGTCIIRPDGTLSVDAYHSSGEYDVFDTSYTIGPGNRFAIRGGDGVHEGTISRDLGFIPDSTVPAEPTRDDWIGSVFLIKTTSSLVEKVLVYGFRSSVTSGHFYAADEAEKPQLIDNHSDIWRYEGIACHAMPNGNDPNGRPVHRLWSGTPNSHFYTIRESEKDKLIQKCPGVWSYEKTTFYACPPGQQPPDTQAVDRFGPDKLRSHFYTMDEAEKQTLLDKHPGLWSYDGVVCIPIASVPLGSGGRVCCPRLG